MAINVCCRYLLIVDCGDTEEHKHLICTSQNCPMMIENAHVIKCCLSESFCQCPFYSEVVLN
jgi:hypothetical protein